MSLRRQLLVVSLLLLSLPWAGCQFIREMEGALRKGQEQSLQATAQAVAAILSDQPQLLYPTTERRGAPPDKRSSVYAHTTQQTVIVDGYGDGWEDIPRTRIGSGTNPRLAVNYFAQIKGEYLYLLLQVEDKAIVYDNPGLSAEPNGDRLVLRFWRNGRRQEYTVTTAAPGSVRARWNGRRERGLDAGQIRGYWQDAIGGYTLELEVPLAYTGGRLGFYFIDETAQAGRALETVGNIRPLDAVAPPWLLYSPATLQTLLAPFSKQANRIQIADQNNWLIADLPATSDSTETQDSTFWLIQLIYRSILSQDNLTAPPEAQRFGKIAGEEIDRALGGRASSKRYRDPSYRQRTTLSAAAPIADTEGVFGAVIIRQSGENYLSLTDRAFSQLLGYSLLAIGIGALGLLGYASMLSWRIRKLSRAASNAITEDGRVTRTFRRSTIKDEIGELSRQYADLLDKVREYNDYLRTLSHKLSHELRTPIAIIQSSLDNLEQADGSGDQPEIYLNRAREGLTRLQRILTAMSEANQLEESIRNNQPQSVELVGLLNEIFEAYRSIYSEHRLLLAIEAPAAKVQAVPDLLVQGLDKLMDNAASFCPAGGEIELQLTATSAGWEIRVSNQGPILPTDIENKLFEPMVSIREKQSDEVHLGLGLHVVRLIADFHKGQVKAANLADHSGVAITLLLPAPAETPN
ncbi:MAG: two-component system sensor histidine kinase ChvG [Halioglobus sp.]|jgi:two-component system sensor histidine kinase ChvG